MILKWIDKMNHFVKMIIAIILLIMTCAVLIQVTVRFVLPNLNIYVSASWTEELSRYLMIWLVFLGAAVSVRESRMLSIDMLVTVLPGLSKKIVECLSFMISIFFYISVFILGIIWIKEDTTTTSSIMGIPKYFVHLSVVVGGFLMIINSIVLLILKMSDKDNN